MANAYSGTTEEFSEPYLTILEYKAAPTGISTNNLTGSNLGANNRQDPNVQDVELYNTIVRASSWIDSYCNQVLAATGQTENLRARVSRDGTVKVHPKYSPIVAVTSFNYGTPGNLNSVADLSTTWIEDQQIIVPLSNLSFASSAGPLQFGWGGVPGSELYINLSYVAGYPNTTIVTAVQDQSSLVVNTPTGITAGQQLNIYDGTDSELVTVSSSYVYGSPTMTLVSPLQYSHNAGIAISSLPASIKQAAILVTTGFLKIRGDKSMVMSVTSTPSKPMSGSRGIPDDFAIAQDLLLPFRRVR